MKRSFSLLLSSVLPFVHTDAVVYGRAAAVCGSKGYDQGIDSYYYSRKTGTYAACSAQCGNDANCKSFAVGSGECDLYNVSVNGNFEADSDSPYLFYDRSCIASSVSSSTSLSKSSTTTMSPTAKTTTTVSSSTTKSRTSTATSSIKTTSITTTATTTTTTSTTKKPSPAPSSSTSTPPCPLPTFVVTDFKFFNSSHNADCANGGSPDRSVTGCLDSNGQWCDPSIPGCTNCGINVCSTGLPPQPVGYGPPDSVVASITYIGSCQSTNPGTTPLREIGDGNVVRCGGSQIQWQFGGDSNSAQSSPLFQVQSTIYCPNGGSYGASGQANVPMTCTYDAGKNATCLLTAGSASIPATMWG